MWTDRTLGDHIGTLAGFAFSSDYFNDSGEGLPLIRIRDIDSTATAVHYSGPYPAAFLVSEGDILVGMDGEFNLKRWQGDKALLNQRVLKVFAKPGGQIDLGFAYYWLAPFLKQVEATTAATTVKHLSAKDVERAVVRSPERLVQGEVARVLRALDNQIEATESLVAKQERVRVGLMQDLFTRGMDDHGRLRPPRDQAPHLYHQTELGWLPLGWETGSILRYCTVDRQPVLTGPFGADLGFADFVDDGVPLLRIGNVQDRHLRLDDLLFVSERKAQQLAKYRITPNDLLFARQGATTGRNALANEKVDGALINYHIIRVSLDPNKCCPQFVESMFNSWLITHQIEQSKGRGTREGINTQQITSLLFPGPGLAEQIRITATLHEVMAAIEAMKDEHAKLALQKTGLMQDLLTGKVSVAPLLESAAA